jgi:23S rRNA pseudouridine1911/1915/1917 synthase
MSEAPEDRTRRKARVPSHLAGQRLDVFLAECFPKYSRRELGLAVKAGLVRVNGKRGRTGIVLAVDDRLELPIWSQVLPELARKRVATKDVGKASTDIVELYRDDDLLVVSKPAGVPVHGGANLGATRTLIELMREDVLAGYSLVHRLDKDTTGAIALVRGEEFRRVTMERFADPKGGIEKIYDAIVGGVPDPTEGVIDAPLSPPGHRGRATVDKKKGKPARTRYRVSEVFVRASRLELTLETGRTHQIRAHLWHIDHPLLADPLYGRRKAWRIPDPRGERDVHLRRTPLHARRLVIPHPRTGKPITVDAPIPEDMKHVLEVLRVVTGRGRKRGGLPPPKPPGADD